MVVDQTRKGIRSPATFLGLTKPLVKLYASTPDAVALGLDEKALGRRCTACKGKGQNRIEMGFLPDVRVQCETCRGTGLTPEAWDVRLLGVPFPEVNALTLDQVYELFSQDDDLLRDADRIIRPLAFAREVGLGYLVWRQPAYTLSGGEAQRLKITQELARKRPRRKGPETTLYILDEPTVGQHAEDVARLTSVLRRLVAEGHTVVVIEHHPQILAGCDWLIELGPGGGPDGGRLVAAGTPLAVARLDTPTAPYLRELLEVAP
jgi:excinuclease ABC subunit A